MTRMDEVTATDSASAMTPESPIKLLVKLIKKGPMREEGRQDRLNLCNESIGL
jgi:hypothetical protein